MDGLAWKQVETKEHVSAVEGNLNSVKAAVDRQLSAVEGSLIGLRSELHEELLEKQEQLRKELRHKLLQDLSAPTELPEGWTEPDCPSICSSSCVGGRYYAASWSRARYHWDDSAMAGSI